MPVYADIEESDAVWIDEHDPHVIQIASEGIGEVGTAAAVGNAVHHATRYRFRRLPIGLDQFILALA